MTLEEITYGTPEHQEMINLRNKILREPLGLVFSEEDLKREENDYLVGCYDEAKIVGCCVLSPTDANTIQLRQMSVEADIQKKGIGGKVLTFSEKLSVKNGFSEIHLHARKVAVDFYKKHGYIVIGNEFIEVGIPHYEMKKQLNYMETLNPEEKQVIENVSKYVDLSVVPFGEPVHGILDIEKRDPMYGGNGVVYMLTLFGKGDLVNNRIGVYMVLMNKGDQAGFHEHGSKKEQELYVIVNGEGEYIERIGNNKLTRTLNLRKGNITSIQGDDSYHSIINTGDEPLIIFVVTTYQPSK